MGREARCRVHFQGKITEAKVLLETNEIVVRGDLKLKVPLAEARDVRAVDGRLSLSFGQGAVAFELGPDAEKWARRIVAPPSRLDKLGVKQGQKVLLLDATDARFAGELAERTGARPLTHAQTGADVIFFEARAKKALAALPKLKGCLTDAGALWILRPKGDPAISERDVMDAGRAAGLTDVKVVAFSEHLTAEKFVIPVAKRKSR
jgi:hypothetical protein